MKTRFLVLIIAAVVAVSSWLSVVLYPSILDFMGSNPFWNGTSDFLRNSGGQAVTGTGSVTADVLVVIPSAPYDTADLQGITNFVNRGGTLLLMDDFGYGNQVLTALGLDVKFAGTMLLDPYLNYRNSRLPVIDDLSLEMQSDGVKSLVLNHATALIIPAGSAQHYDVLARSSDMSFLDSVGDGSRSATDPAGPLPVAVRTEIGHGTVIVVSDPSILINSMAGLGDNRKFVTALIDSSGKSIVAVDNSHLRKTPLDSGKEAWTVVRSRLASPYALAVLAAGALVLSFIPVWRKGVAIER